MALKKDTILPRVCIYFPCSSHAVTSDLSLAEVAKAAEFFLSDGLIVTGSSTGSPTSKEDVEEVRGSTSLPVLVGSGVDLDSIGCYSTLADGLIVGSGFKEGGKWFNPLDTGRVVAFMDKILSRN